MTTVPDVGVCCKVTIKRAHCPSVTRWVYPGTLAETVEDALRLAELHDADVDEFSITVEREGHDA